MQILPKDQAEKYPQGEGRNEPNSDPFLPEPEGRIQLSLNPFTMIAQLIPAPLLRKIICLLIVLACCALCVMMAPMIFSNFVSSLLF